MRRATNYDTEYVYSDTESRRAAASFTRARRNTPVVARWYTLRTNRARVGVCEHLYLIKDLYLQRKEGTAMTIEEQREFYTAAGQLIATKTENVSHQLTKTGVYTASVPLPIPENAPAGSYRIVSRLVAKIGNSREHTLATANGEFRVK